MPFDPEAAVAHVRQADPVLGRLIERVGPLALRPSVGQDPFEALIQAIIYQQLSGRVAAVIAERFAGRFAPTGKPDPRAVQAADVEELRSVGLSRSKALAIQDLAAKVLDGTVPALAVLEALEDEAVIERLTAVRGIGRWTAEMFLLFRLGRPDVLPVADYGVRKGFARVYGLLELPRARELAAHGERWRPYRSVASWYLWRALELPEPM